MPFSLLKFGKGQETVLTRYLIPLLIVGAWTLLVKWIYPHIDLVNLEMTYLCWCAVIALRYGQGPAVASCILSVMCFDFFFIPPYFTMTVAERKYWLTFAVMLAITLLISRLTLQSKRSAEE